MDERTIFMPLLWGWTGLALLLFPILFFIVAPYGRHTRKGWGPEIPSTLGWILMEAPSPIGFAIWFLLGDRKSDPAAIAFLVLWQVHYLNRAFVFPLRRRGGQKPMPLAIALQGCFFNLVNAYLNGRYLFTFGPVRGAGWLADPRFLVGALLFFAGLAINLHADGVLRDLRRPGETGYRIPEGGLYRFITCPNYFGEVLEWIGFAICTFSPAGLAFAVWTAANLLPRARANHRWYLDKFPDYPKSRRAVIPLLM